MLVDVGLLGRLLEVAHLLGAVRERVQEKALRALPAFRLCRLRCFTLLARLLTRFLARLGGELVASVDGSAVAASRKLGDVREGSVGVGLERGAGAHARAVGGLGVCLRRSAAPLPLRPRMPRGLLLENFRLRAPEQRRQDGTEDCHSGLSLEIESDDVADSSEGGSREHGARSLATEVGARTISPRTAVCEEVTVEVMALSRSN